MKRIQIVMLDDRPEASGIPKLDHFGFMNNRWLPSPSGVEATAQDDSLGVQFRTILPADLEATPQSDWENTIFLVDVNWDQIPAGTPGFEGVSMQEKMSYGVELAHDLICLRDELNSKSIHILFYSNTRQDLVYSNVRLWKKQGEENIDELIFGFNHEASLEVVSTLFSAYDSIAGSILKKAGPKLMGEALIASTRAHARRKSDENLILSDFLGACENEEIDGFRLADIAWPYLRFANHALVNPHRVLEMWKAHFDTRLIQIPAVSSKCGESATVLRAFLRYGQRGSLATCSKRLGVVKGKALSGLSFADFYLLEANISSSTQLSNPHKTITDLKALGLEVLERTPSEWSLFNSLNSNLSTKLWGELKKENSTALPAALRQPGVFSIERKDWNPEARIRIVRKSKPTIYWALQVDPMTVVSCPYIEAMVVADRYRQNPGQDLRAVWDAWKNDQDHLELLEILAENVDSLMQSENVDDDAKKSLVTALRRWGSNVKLAIHNINEAHLLLKQIPDGNECVASLRSQLRQHVLPRMDGWRELSELYESAAGKLSPVRVRFSEKNKGLLST
ncbi:hypothetical protein Verru16b_03233 [Lacunisphaera limnophila]|uniref:Uncharacterized protein n=1 Tax=Lacunisphaera limnophila TaxID=1838286 RepID=A0A1D8AZ25_9BACT|nr:hypothetical protein [Lacunisphaera limnophila]AOS46137.1 hypothetical protein Verru16b_03233 [Lacunisphaera limnophila]